MSIPCVRLLLAVCCNDGSPLHTFTPVSSQQVATHEASERGAVSWLARGAGV
jgi:hypothetical protein